ncbi:MAG: hypothetical protein MJ168_05305 [Clostridia bacterium]|nr:hypothetical protein [Clostridia bacterium]
MFCNICGKINDEGTNICIHCGNEITETKLSNPDIRNDSNLSTNSLSENLDKKFKHFSSDTTVITQKAIKKIKDNKNKYKKILIPASILIITVILITVTISLINSKVSLKKYVADELVFSGVNGYGSINSINNLISWDELNRDIIKKNPSTKDIHDFDSLSTASILSGGTVSKDIKSYISINLDDEVENGKLSNGDKITVNFVIDQEGIKKNPYFSKRIKEKNGYKLSFTVSGLNEGTKIDVFEAIDCYIYDDNSYDNQDGLLFKSDYKKEYEQGIEVCYDNGVKIYGEDFSSIRVNFERSNDKIIESNTQSVKFKLNIKPDEYIKYGIILDSVEKDVNVVKLAFADENSISKADITTLTAKANEYARTEFETGHTLAKIKFYYGEYLTPTLSYFYKTSEGYCVVHFDGLKIRSDNMQLYNLDNQKADSYGWWGHTTYKTIEDYETGELAKTIKSCEISTN